MQRRLLERWSPLRAVVAVSVVFAFFHVMPHAIVVAFPVGLWFGIIAWRTGSIGPGIACHAFVNGGVNAWRLIVKFGDVSEATQGICYVIFILFGTICFVLACRVLASYSSGTPVSKQIPG
jgi:membrane protease YdiL (CAAX protease family)